MKVKDLKRILENYDGEEEILIEDGYGDGAHIYIDNGWQKIEIV